MRPVTGLAQIPQTGVHDVGILGGPSGSLESMRHIPGALPPHLAAAVVLYLRLSELSPTLLFACRGTLPPSVREARVRILPGHLYVAPRVERRTWDARARRLVAITQGHEGSIRELDGQPLRIWNPVHPARRGRLSYPLCAAIHGSVASVHDGVGVG
jgi:hypothetical protein